MKKALITGVTGQDGSYLAELLLAKGYEIHGLIRRSSSLNTNRIDHLYADPHRPDTRFFIHYIDLTDSSALARLVSTIRPDEIYHLGAQSHVRVSFDVPEYTGNVTGLGTVRILEAIRETGVNCRFYQASSSEMFGRALEVPQRETTPFRPVSPYGAAKVFAYWMTVNYRESYGVYACNGILFNHESPRRGEMFVTRKITRGIAEMLDGKIDKIYLGNLDARRDWGYAPEYVEAMWLMMQQDEPQDFVIATGESHTVREFATEAFRLVGISDWQRYVGNDARYLRPAEVDRLEGDASKARRELGWVPKVRFPQLVSIMVEADLKAAGLEGKLVNS